MKLLNKYEYKIPKIWFYETKGVQDVETLEEIKTAKIITNSISRVFLETRALVSKKTLDIEFVIIFAVLISSNVSTSCTPLVS